MTAAADNPDPPSAGAPASAPVRGGPWPAQPPTYDRDSEDQAAFERAVARLWARDFWVNPETGERELNADLVLEGGGVKGIGLAGAILVLAEAGYRFPRAAGTSAGAIAAVLVASIEKSGQDMTVLRDYLSDIDYQQFMQAGPVQRAFERVGGRFAEGCELIFRPGLYSGDYLRAWLGAKLAACGVETWADLAISASDDPGMSLPECQRYRAVVHVSDISRGTLARLPWDYSDFYGLPPDAQDVIGAVRASMSIPFFFAPVRTVAKPSHALMPDGSTVTWPGGTVTWVDGGMLMNFPISAFDRVDGAAPRWPTIGIKLSAEPGVQPADVPVQTTMQEGLRCLHTMMGEWDQYHVAQATANRTIFVANAGLTATQFDLKPDQQRTLFQNGADAANQVPDPMGRGRRDSAQRRAGFRRRTAARAHALGVSAPGAGSTATGSVSRPRRLFACVAVLTVMPAPLRNEGRHLCYVCPVVFSDAERAGGSDDAPADRDDQPAFDTSVAHQARIYDYWLGGKDNYAADRKAAEAAIAAYPGVATGARANRQFLARAVRHLAGKAGIQQFLDIGTGIPTANNTHEVAQSVAPESRVVYVDYDPIVLIHARALLASHDDGHLDYLDADLRDPETILGQASRTLDFSRPVAIMLIAILHAIGDDDDPYQIVARLIDAVPPGSYLVLSHVASDIDPEKIAEATARLNQLSHQHFTLRNHAEVTRFFTGLELLEPGVVRVEEWRPVSELEGRNRSAMWGAVAHKR